MPPRAFLAVVLLSGHAGAGRLICSRATSGVEHGIADAATMAFMNDTDLTDVNKPALVFDVGANNGDYSCKLLETLRSRVHSRRVHLHMIEPQPQFRRGLQRIADHFGGTFVGKAAWRGPPTNISLFTGRSKSSGSRQDFSDGATLLRPDKRTNRYMSDLSVPVETFDLAAYMLEATEVAGKGPVLMKLDVEGAEFNLLPDLITSSALCRVRYLHIEWHPLKGLPGGIKAHEERIAGLAMRYALRGLLQHGCGGNGPRLISHEDFKEERLMRSYLVHEFSHTAQRAPLADWCINQGGISVAGISKRAGCGQQNFHPVRA